MSEAITEIGSGSWDEAVLKAPRAIVDFYSTECPPCEALAAKFEPLAEVYGEDVKFIKIFRQENRDLAKSLGVSSSPTVLFYENGVLRERFSGAILRRDLVKHLDAMLPAERANELHRRFKPRARAADVLILGAGPAGLTAAIYAAQAKANTVVVDVSLPGGQVGTTHQVSNYPGFVDPIPGYQLAHVMREQAARAGAQFIPAVEVTEVDLHDKTVVLDGLETIRARAIILATGASPRPLGIPGENRYRGRGISTCATCDGKYHEGRELLVIGGGDSALEETLFLTKFASKITIVHRGETLRAKAKIQEEVAAHPKIEVLLRHQPREFRKEDDGTMVAVLESTAGGPDLTLHGSGIFLFTGMRPNVAGLSATLETDDQGYLLVSPDMETSLPGVFAAGDVVRKSVRQITVAVAEGTIAGIHAVKSLSGSFARSNDPGL